MNFWSKEQTLHLIKWVSQEPILYTTGDASYSNKIKKKDVFQNIFEKLKIIKPDTSIKDIKNKLKTLRSQYKREKILVQRSIESGAGVDQVYKPKLWCFDELQFFEDDPEMVPTFCSIPPTDVDISDSSIHDSSNAMPDWSCDEGTDVTNINKNSNAMPDWSCDEDTSPKSKKRKRDPSTSSIFKYAQEILDIGLKLIAENEVSHPSKTLGLLVAEDLKNVDMDIFCEARQEIVEICTQAIEKQMDRTRNLHKEPNFDEQPFCDTIGPSTSASAAVISPKTRNEENQSPNIIKIEEMI